MTAEIRAATGTVVQIGTLEIRLSARPPVSSLPGRVFGFVGRGAELAAIARAATRGCTAAQVTGRPGAGKSALATEAAHALRGHYPDGQVTIELHGHDGARPPTAHELLGRVLRILGTADRDIPADHAERLDGYGRAMAGCRVLLLADDAASTRQVRDLLPPPGSLLLVTSRRVLAGLGSDVFTLRLGELDGAAALAVLQTARPDAARDALGELAGLCAGLPLALRIVAARLALEPSLPVDRLRDLLGDDGRRLGELAAGDRAVRASFGFSYQRLGDDTRLVFRRCAALPLVDLTAASAAAASGLDEPTAAAALADLAAAHLLDGADHDGADHDGAGRLRIHDLLRLFASERMAAEDTAAEVAAARDALVAHYLRHVAALDDITTARSWFAAEWDNVVVVAHRLAETGAPGLHELADRIVSEQDLPIPWDGWSRIQTAAIDDARRRGDVARTADLQVRLGIALRERRLLRPALAQLAGAEQRYRQLGDLVGAAGAVGNEAEVFRDLRDDDRAARRFEQAIELLGADRSPDAVASLGWVRHGLGDVRTGQGRPVDALRWHRLALADFRAVGLLFGQAWAWHGTGDALRARGRPLAATAAYRRALAVHVELGNVASAGWTEQNLGETLIELDRPEQAGRSFERALAAAVTRTDSYSQARALMGLGDVASGGRAGELWSAGLDVLGSLDEELAEHLRTRLSTI